MFDRGREAGVMYHGVLVDQAFIDPEFPKKFKVFAEKQVDGWKLFGVEVVEANLGVAVESSQENMQDGPWYIHFYNGEEVVVVFKERVFSLSPDLSDGEQMVEYGKALGISSDQLFITPRDFIDEKNYFAKE